MAQSQRRLELVHLQITKQCNLHCWFCGQWGDKGCFSSKRTVALEISDWQGVVASLERYSQNEGNKLSVILWGGEPLLSAHFEALVRLLAEKGFTIGLVTNGTLLRNHAELCKKYISRIYVSIDGVAEVHNSIRGAGVFESVAQQLEGIRGGKAKLTLMTVMTTEVFENLHDTLTTLEKLEPDEILLQEMIALTSDEISDYKAWMQQEFDVKAVDIESWYTDKAPERRDHEWYTTWLTQHTFSCPVRHIPHGAETGRPYCLSPERHLHIAWDGEVSFCTDFTDFSLGNIRSSDLIDLFEGPRSQDFAQQVRNGKCVTCNHCSWRNSDSFYL